MHGQLDTNQVALTVADPEESPYTGKALRKSSAVRFMKGMLNSTVHCKKRLDYFNLFWLPELHSNSDAQIGSK